MPIYDDDEDLRNGYDASRAGWETDDTRDPQEIHDIVPDDLIFVPCTHCRKLIFEISHRCPYCRQLQLFEDRERKPLWLWVSAMIAAVVLAGSAVATILILLRWR